MFQIECVFQYLKEIEFIVVEDAVVVQVRHFKDTC